MVVELLNPVNKNLVLSIVNELKQLKNSSPDNPLIMVTAINLGHNYLKLLYYLKKQGAIVVLIVADGMMCNTVSFNMGEKKK